MMVTGISAVLRASERRTTETHLALLDLATGTWERSAGRKLARRAAPGAELDPATEELFIVSEGDASVEDVRDQFSRAPEPKKLVILLGDAHAQHIFKTEHAKLLTDTITQWLHEN